MKKPTPEALERAMSEFEVAETKFRSATQALAHAKKRQRDAAYESDEYRNTNLRRLWAGHKVASLLSRLMPRDTSKVAVLIARRQKRGAA